MKNKELTIQNADKGNTFVLINRADYTFESKLILEDTSKFEKIKTI